MEQRNPADVNLGQDEKMALDHGKTSWDGKNKRTKPVAQVLEAIQIIQHYKGRSR
jgi:hypothetical protein